MNKCCRFFLILVICSRSFEAQSQAATITVRSAVDGIPIPGAIVMIKPIGITSGKEQEILFSNDQGLVSNSAAVTSEILIHCFGFSDVKDTIEAGRSHVFELTPAALNLDEVVVSGQYDLNTSDQSVYRVSVITAPVIQSMAAQNLTDVLRQQLDFRVTQDNILGSGITMNGISGQNIKILVDGIPVIGRQNGNIDISQINMSNVERIEIIEGPMSVSYGTDALGGLINIVTKKSSDYPVDGGMNLYYESVGTYNVDASLYGRYREHGISFNGGRYFFDGYSEADTSRYQEWKPKLNYFTNLQYNYTGRFFNASLTSGYFHEEVQNKGVPVITPYQAYAFDDYYFTRRLNESLILEHRLKNNATFQLTNGYNNYRQIRNTVRKDLVSLEEEYTTAAGTQDTSLFDEWTLRGTYSSTLPVRKLNFQFGYDVNLQSARGGALSQGTSRINDYAVFGSAEYRLLQNFYVRPGLRVAYNSRFGSPVTPSLNLKYDLSERYNLRAAYARGFRAPSLKELDMEFVDANHNIYGNDSLQAETSDNLSASFSSDHALAAGQLRTELSIFYNNIHNIITLAQPDAAVNYHTYINVNRYKTHGLSFKGDFRLKTFTFGAGVSLLNLYNSLADTVEVDKYSLTPEFQTSIISRWPKLGLEAAVFFKSTGSTPSFHLDENGEVYQTFLDSYTMLDFTVTKSLAAGKVSLGAGIKNIFNVTSVTTNAVNNGFHASEAGSVPYAMGRFVFASMKIKLYKA